MFRTKYIILLILPLLFSSCLRSPDKIVRIATKLDKDIYKISENIVLSYTFDGYNGNNVVAGKTYGEIVLRFDKKTPSKTGDILEKKSFQVIDAGKLATRYENDTFYACLFRNSEGVPLDGKLVLMIDEPGTYIMRVSCLIKEEDYDGPVVVVDNRSFLLTVQ